MIKEITQTYNHKLNKDLQEKALRENNEEWYRESLKQSNLEFLDWLMKE